MRLDVAIETTQIGQNIVQMAVVMPDKRTLLTIIKLDLHSVSLDPAFLVVINHIRKIIGIIAIKRITYITSIIAIMFISIIIAIISIMSIIAKIICR